MLLTLLSMFMLKKQLLVPAISTTPETSHLINNQAKEVSSGKESQEERY